MAKSEIEEQVRRNSAFFTSLIELIPAKYYLPDDALPKESFPDLTTISGKAAREVKKRLAKKAKLLKLDPSKHKTVAELQKEIEEREKELLNGDTEESVSKPIKVDEISSLPLDDLRQKLHDKLQSLRGKRKLKDEEKSSEHSKKRKLEKQLKKKKSKENAKTSSEVVKVAVNNEKKASQLVNDRGEIVFSKFDFAGSQKSKKGKGNIEHLLKKAEQKKETIEKLEDEDKEKADSLKTKLQWSKAFKQAGGEKVKDDPKLLMKTLKRKKKIKDVSKKKWDERADSQKKLQDDKQKLRKKHLLERKQGAKGAKGGKNKKQGKSGKKHKPGF